MPADVLAVNSRVALPTAASGLVGQAYELAYEVAVMFSITHLNIVQVGAAQQLGQFILPPPPPRPLHSLQVMTTHR